MVRKFMFAAALAVLFTGGISTGAGSPTSISASTRPCWAKKRSCPPTTTTTTTTTTTPTTTTTTTPTTTADTSTPAPIAGQGYGVVFSDDFNLFDATAWNDHQWYESGPPAGAISVANGVLHLQSTRANGWNEANVATDRKKTWKYGYFEARIKWTGVQGAWPGFWLFSEAQRDGQTSASLQTSEIDIMEGDGNYPNGYNTALHSNSSNMFGVPDQTCPSNNFHADLGLGNLTTDWHTYGLLWTPTSITWYLDGRPIAGPCPPWPNSTDQPMFMILTMAPGGAASGKTPPSGASMIETQVDWVRVWQKP